MSRRDLGLLVPVLAAAAAARTLHAETASAQTPAALPALRTTVYHHAGVPYAGNDDKKGRRFLMQQTHGGFRIEAHETILGPSVETHEPHRHRHEEIIIVVEGTVEVFRDGTTETAEAGSVIVFGSNDLHSARNIGKVPARYYVIELRGDE
jgi:quercetin dioxygenase-like cupin family protein